MSRKYRGKSPGVARGGSDGGRQLLTHCVMRAFEAPGLGGLGRTRRSTTGSCIQPSFSPYKPSTFSTFSGEPPHRSNGNGKNSDSTTTGTSSDCGRSITAWSNSDEIAGRLLPGAAGRADARDHPRRRKGLPNRIGHIGPVVLYAQPAMVILPFAAAFAQGTWSHSRGRSELCYLG